MLRVVRVILLVAMFFLALSLVMAIGRPETGPWEKAVLGGVVAALIVLARPVPRLG